MQETLGTKLKIGTDEVANLTRIGEISLGEADENEVTTLTSGRHRKFQAGLIDAGTVEVEGFFTEDDTDGQVALMTLLESGSETGFSIAHPSTATTDFNGFVKSFVIGEATPEGLLTFKAAIRISGAVDFTPAL